ncbi:MAG TPA: hypothetical protein VIR29_07535 [Anseongella sp.]
MDLENIIPLIIIAVAYLFKAFGDAKKKDARKKPRPPVHKPAPLPQSRKEGPSPSRVPEPGPAAYPGPSTTEQQPSRPLVPKDWWEADYPPVSEQPEAIRPVVREDFAQQRISNEARRQREAQQRKQQETVMLQKEEPVVTYLEEDEPFDLRDAVIKSVILERKEF